MGVVVCVGLEFNVVCLESRGRSGLHLFLRGLGSRDIYECVLLRRFSFWLYLTGQGIEV